MRPHALAASLLLLASAVAAARADSVRVVAPGDTVEGVAEAGVLEAIPFDAVDGSLLSVTLKMAPGSGPLVAILQPDRTLVPDLLLYGKADAKDASWKGKKIPLAQSGRHWILAWPAVPGAYSLKFKVKPLTKARYAGFVLPSPAARVTFGGVPGALATITAKRGKPSALEPKVLSVGAPGGGDLDLGTAASRRTTPTLDQVKALPLPAAGDYEARVGTQSGLAGDVGTIAISVKFPRPPKTKRSDADLLVDPFVDAVNPPLGFDNLAYEGFGVQGEFFRPGSSIRIEDGVTARKASAVSFVTSEFLLFDADLAGLPAGTYDLVVTLPNGAAGRLADGFTVRPTPLPSAVVPSTGFDNRTQTFVVQGDRFQAGATVSARPSAGGAPVPGSVLSVTTTSISVSLPLLDAALGGWDLIVSNPDGGANTLAAGLQVLRGPRVTGASPLLGHDNDAARAVAVAGDSFQAGMACVLERPGESPIPGTVSGLAPASATATFDLRGRAAGAWSLRVTNPDGGTLTAPSPFVVARAPRLLSVDPARGFEGETESGVGAAGTDLVSGASAVLERDGSPTVAAANESVGGGGTTIAFDLPLAGAAAGLHDLRVTNPDGGSERLADAFRVMGTGVLESSASAAGPPEFAYDAENDAFLAVWSAFDGSQWDVKARLYDGETGEPLGSEIAVTSVADDGSSTLDQVDPSALFVPAISFGDGETFTGWIVTYAWKDPNAEGNRAGARLQLLERDGTVHTPSAQAFPLGSYLTGTAGPPRAAWNPGREECLAVWAWDLDASPDVHHAILGGWTEVGGVLIPFSAGTGALIANSHGSPDAVQDRDFEPDVAFGEASAEWVVVYTFDFVESGMSPPPDGKSDVRAIFFDEDFSGGPVATAHLTTLGDASSKDDRRGRVEWDPGTDTFLVAWDHEGSAGNRDVRAWLLDGATRAKVGTSFTTVEPDASADAAFPALAFDGTLDGESWIVAFVRAPGVAGSASILATRLPVDAVASTGIGTPSASTLAAALPNALFAGPAVAPRGVGGEFLSGWSASGSGKAPVDAEIRPAR
jgi:hypothetical protein